MDLTPLNPTRVISPAPRAVGGTSALVAVAVFGSMLLGPKIGPNMAVTDIVIAGVVALGFRRIGRGSPARRLLQRSMPWLWLILLGSVAGLAGVGLTGWAVDTLIRDAFSFAIFFAVFELASERNRVLRVALDAVAVAVALLALVIVATGDIYRPSGTFANPNYAGHFLAFGATLLFTTGYRSLAVRWGLLALAGVAIFRTGSFGSAAMVLGGALFYMLQRLRHDRRRPLRLVFAMLLVLFLTSMWQTYRAAEEASYVLGPSISSYRLQNTSHLREQLWGDALALVPDKPFGVGPYGIKSRALLLRGVEVHNDALAYLVERGIIGLIGLVGFLLALRRSALPGGGARLLLVLVIVGGVFRETLHFRHMWIFLGLAFANDAARRRTLVEADAIRPAQ